MFSNTLIFKIIFPIVLLGVSTLPVNAAMFSITTPDQGGVSITTTLDTDINQLIYSFDFTSLPYDYENIAFSPSPLPAFTGIPLQAGAVTSAGSTEVNFHQLYDDTGTFIDWALELQYATNSPPARNNSIVINYNSSLELTGNFLGQPGDDNFQVTYRKPVGGFPVGQDDNVTYWIYTPEIQLAAVPIPSAVFLFASGLLGLLGLAKKNHKVLAA